jgi:hypothetical protein
MSSKANPTTEKQSANYLKFMTEFGPLEATVLLLTDHRTGARYAECHVKGSKLLALGTTDVPLDPEEQAEYRANREIVENAPAYARMIDDAKLRRSFSNIVTEYTTEFDKTHPLKIIGGQHRFEAIRAAHASGIDEYHGVKVYFDMNVDQRLDVQLISNTNIAISGDLFDRMHETVMGPELRDWFQSVGLLEQNTDFADRRSRGGPVSVQLARTFVLNYFEGAKIDAKKFDTTETTPELCATGVRDLEWEALRLSNPNLWKDAGLIRAGKQFAMLLKAQRAAFTKGQKKFPPDYPEKATNPAILAAWAYTAGMLRNNEVRLKRHYALATATGHDPLNVAALVKGRHKSDPDQYRGLGYRTDPKERGRFAELFFLQSENGEGVSKSNIDVAIAQFHAKGAALEVGKLKAKAASA